MPPVLIKILLSLLWAAIGAAAAWLSFLALKKQADVISPGSEASIKQLPIIIAGRILRLILVGVILYLAIRMDTLYAIVFVVALTITTWILAAALNRKANKLLDDYNKNEGD